METLDKLNKWANNHPSVLIDLIRVLFGAFLIHKGLYFMNHTGELISILDPEDYQGNLLFLVHYIAFIHIGGGVLIALGLLTRTAVLLQIPILIGAVAVHAFGVTQAIPLIQSSVALLAALMFAAYGSGKRSLDHAMGSHKLEFEN